MIGEVVDLFLGFSPGVDIVNDPGEANGFSGLGIGGDGSFLNSHELPGIVAQAKFMIEYLASLQMTGQGDHAVGEVFRVNAVQEQVARSQRVMTFDMDGAREVACPGERITFQIPFIEQVPRGDEQTDEIGYCTAFVSNRRKAGNGYVSQI
jgi:hypothetical protein